MSSRDGEGFGGRRPRSDEGHPSRGRRSTDEDALALRGEGHSFASIASRLRLKRSKDAYASFRRALDARRDDERAVLVEQELGRLVVLEARIRERDAAEPERMAHRLAALEAMRKALG